MTVLGHAVLSLAVLCLASKMRRHCVGEDSDAVAHNSKISSSKSTRRPDRLHPVRECIAATIAISL